MKRFKLSVVLFLVSFQCFLFAQNYQLENTDDSEPLYFDFVYPPKAEIKIPKPRTNFIKDEVILLYPIDKSHEITRIAKKFNLKPGAKTLLSSVKTGMVVAKTNGQNPLSLSESINKNEKDIESSTNNIFKPAINNFRNDYSMSDTGVRQVQKTTKGKGITVCMIDTPVDIFHPSFSNSLIETLDLIKYNPNDEITMLHGTAVAGVLVSQNKHIGIAPLAKLYAVSAFHAKNAKVDLLQGSSSDVAKAMNACIQHKVDIINLSFTGGKDSLLEKMVKKAVKKGIIVVAAGGNGGNWGSTIYPALIPGVIAATATDEDKHLFDMADKGRFIDFAAPGVNILTLAPNGKYKLATGTSISSAHVSGIIALLLSQKKNKDINKILTETAIDLGKPGRDQEFGDGLISASRALELIKHNK